MKCARRSVQNEWRAMGAAAANRGMEGYETAVNIINPGTRALFMEGYEAEMAKKSRAAIRAIKQKA